MQEQRCSKCGQVMMNISGFGNASRQAAPPTTHAQCSPGPTLELYKNGATATSRSTASRPIPPRQSVVPTHRWDLNERPSFVHYAGLDLVCLLLFITLVIASYALDSVALPTWSQNLFGWTPSSYPTIFLSLSPLPPFYVIGCNLELWGRTYKLAADGRHLLIISGILFRRIAQVDLLHVSNITDDQPLSYRPFTKKEEDVRDILLFVRPPQGTEELVVIPAMRGGRLLKERLTQYILTLRRLLSRPR